MLCCSQVLWAQDNRYFPAVVEAVRRAPKPATPKKKKKKAKKKKKQAKKGKQAAAHAPFDDGAVGAPVTTVDAVFVQDNVKITTRYFRVPAETRARVGAALRAAKLRACVGMARPAEATHRLVWAGRWWNTRAPDVTSPFEYTPSAEARRSSAEHPDCNESAAFAQLRPGFLTAAESLFAKF